MNDNTLDSLFDLKTPGMSLSKKKIDKTLLPISTGSLSLDRLTGAAGYPRGSIIELYGGTGAGKTTFALCAIKEAQGKRQSVVYFDVDQSLDATHATNFGIDIDRLYMCEATSLEDMLISVKDLVLANTIDLIVVDSIANLLKTNDLLNKTRYKDIIEQSKEIKYQIEVLSGVVSASNTVILFLDQIRDSFKKKNGKLGTSAHEITFKNCAVLRLAMKASSLHRDDETVLGARVKITIEQSKITKPGGFVEFDIYHKDGISFEGELLDIAVAKGIINKAGSWYSYEEINMGQGRTAAIDYLKNDIDLSEDIFNKIEELI